MNDSDSATTSSATSKISTRNLKLIMDKLKCKTVRDTTAKNYFAIWRLFNNFLIRLDNRPESWEERTSLFCAYLIDTKKLQSQTLRSYKSAIKAVLTDDGYQWDESKLLLNSLTRACKLKNDCVKCRFPIKKGLLELILFELKRVLSGQSYLQTLYRALFCLAYYGLMRIGELAEGPHAIKAANIHIGQNKDKILIVLYSSKTHGKESYPQKIKIAALNEKYKETRLFCPFTAVRNFLQMRGDYKDEEENLFILSDRSNVTPSQVRNILRDCLQNLNLNSMLYDCHSFRIGKATDMKIEKFSISEIKTAGRWRSNAIFRYLRE